MSKRLIVILALAMLVGFTCAAYAEVQNVKVSGDVQVSGVLRKNLTLSDNVNSSPANIADFSESISAILSQIRLRVDADLTDNVTATVRLLNERVWGEENDTAANSVNNDTDIDLDLAYVTLKEFLYSPLTLTVGRQELYYGNGFIIGDVDGNSIAAGHGGTQTGGTNAKVLPNSLDDLSLRKAFDAIKATLDYDPLVIDLVLSKIDESDVAMSDDVDLYGLNAGYAVNKNLNTEVYLWQRSRKTTPGGALIGNSKDENLRTAGARLAYTGIKNLTLGLEGAFQFGDHIANATLYPDELGANVTALKNRRVSAYAIQAGALYVMPKKKYSPSILVAYTHLSGDKYNSDSDNYRGWDPMFENQGTGTLYNKIFSFSNTQAVTVKTSIRPLDDLTAKLDYAYIRLLEPYTRAATAVTLSGVAGDPRYIMKEGKKNFGQEVDLILTYDYTEDVQLCLNSGMFIPMDAFNNENKKSATQVIGSMKVTF